MLELSGDVPFVTATPPAVYPEPETSPVAEYTVVEALSVAEDTLNHFELLNFPARRFFWYSIFHLLN